MKLTVARIGRAHGLKGEVSVEVRTDIPEERLVAGAVFQTEPASAGPMTILSTRTQGGRWYIKFVELNSREDADSARGVELVIEGETSDEEDAWYVHELVGLEVERSTGESIGKAVDLMAAPAHDLLVVKQPSGKRALIPFVDAFLVEVDVDAGRIVIDPPYGLLDGEEPEVTGETH